MAQSEEEMEDELRKQTRKELEAEIEAEKAAKEAAEKKSKRTKKIEDEEADSHDAAPDDEETDDEGESGKPHIRDRIKGHISNAWQNRHPGNTLLWAGFAKLVLFDWLILGGWLATESMAYVAALLSFFYALVFGWVIHFKGLKVTDHGLKYSFSRLLICVMVMALDLYLIQSWLLGLTGDILWNTSKNPFAYLTGIIFVYRKYISWWVILAIFDRNNTSKPARAFRFVYILLFFIGFVQMLFGIGVTAAISDAVKSTTGIAEAAEVQMDKETRWLPANWDRIKCCWNDTASDCCSYIGRPAGYEKSLATAKGKKEVTILRGGTDESLNQDIVLKLSASRNAPVNYWEKEITATGTLEATSFKRNIEIELECGLKSSNNYVKDSGEMNPDKVLVNYLNIIGEIKDLNCKITKPSELRKGANTVYFKAKLQRQLDADAYLVAYFIREGDLHNDLNFYISNDESVRDNFLTIKASGGLAEAQKQLYARMYASIISNDYPDGTVESKSEIAFIKPVITLGEIPLHGITKDSKINLQIGIENMVDRGRITKLRNGIIELPSWLVPESAEKCKFLHNPVPVDGTKLAYSINQEILDSAKLEEIKFGEINQKKFAPCTLKVAKDPSAPDVLYNPSTLNPKVIQLRIGYDYEMEATGTIEVRETDLTKNDEIKVADADLARMSRPLTSATADDIRNNFGLPGYGSRPREGVTIDSREDEIVYSATGGRIAAKGCNAWGGNFVVVHTTDGSNYDIIYTHLKQVSNVMPGDEVIAGETKLGTVGTTAGCLENCDDSQLLCGKPQQVRPQLHFGVYDGPGGQPLKPFCALRRIYGATC